MHIAIESPSAPTLPPAANRLEVDPSFSGTLGAGTRMNYRLQLVTPAVGQPGDPGYQAERVETLKEGTVNMTLEQWRDWEQGGDVMSDATYIIGCVATNLGLEPTLVGGEPSL